VIPEFRSPAAPVPGSAATMSIQWRFASKSFCKKPDSVDPFYGPFDEKQNLRILRFLGSVNRTSAATQSSRVAVRAGQIVRCSYLRAAQAYMLISMPTATSTIFGVFQVIRVLPTSFGAVLAPRRNLGPTRTPRKCGTSTLARRYFSLGPSNFSLGQNAPTRTPRSRAACHFNFRGDDA
jgi:hypothetical protein